MLSASEKYAQAAANFEEFCRNVEILEYIAHESGIVLPDYVREAAQELLKLFAGGSTDWQEFSRQMAGAMTYEAVSGTVNMVIDVAVLLFKVRHPVLGLLVSIGKDVIKDWVADKKAEGEAMIDAHAYYSLYYAAMRKFNGLLDHSGDYIEYAPEDEEYLYKYEVHAAQARITGLDCVRSFLTSGKNSAKPYLKEFGLSASEISDKYKAAITSVYDAANYLVLILSDKLPMFKQITYTWTFVNGIPTYVPTF